MASARLPSIRMRPGGARLRVPAAPEKRLRPALRSAACPLALLALCAFLWSGCDADLQKILNDVSGKPKASSASESVPQSPLPIPPGPHLYCITNVGHTLVLYDLTSDQAQTGLQRYLDLDPVGPWFSGGRGYYISRVDTSGNGSNALIEFFPQTAVETRRLGLGVNTNPNSMLVLPGFGGVAWIAIRGSTFNFPYGPDGIGVVSLVTMTGNISPLSNFVPGGSALHSPISFVWDAACPARVAGGGGPCAYAIVNGFDGILHNGTLLVLAPDGSGNPVWLDSIALGLNPIEDLFLDAARHQLWIVNNGGFTGGSAGTLQVLDTAKFNDGISGNETVATIAAGFAPTGIFGFDANTGWVTTYPSDHVQSVDLGTQALNANPGLPNFTGSIVHTTTPSAQLFAGAGGFGAATLARLNPSNGQLIASNALQAGNGTVSCAEFITP